MISCSSSSTNCNDCKPLQTANLIYLTGMILFDIYTKEKQKQMFCLLLKVRFPKSSFKKRELPGSMSTFGDSNTTNNLKPPKLLSRTLLHVSSHTCKHMHNWPVFTIKLLINISLSINIATKFMECIASKWVYRLYSNNNFVLSPCFL